MIIHTPRISNQNGDICVSARFELQTVSYTGPDTLWFSFPEKFGQFSGGRTEGFSAALLLLAMFYGEDMNIRGALSERFAHGIEEYQRVFNSWVPKRFKLIKVQCTSYESSDFYHSHNVGCAFSGGIDSFYTLWSHLEQNEPKLGYQISHALFMHGLDIGMEDEQTYYTVLRAYDGMMRGLGLELVYGKTNIHQILNPTVGWKWANGAALISVPLVLDRLFGRFYVPGSYTYADVFPWGSDPRLDHLLSTESLEILHDGAAVTRVEKTVALAKWRETYSRLRVCWVRPDGLRNCCRCNKCIRTMTTLEALGALNRYTTFPVSLVRQDVRRCRFLDEDERIFARQVLNYAIIAGKTDISFDLRYAICRSYVRLWYNRISRLVGRPLRWAKPLIAHRT